MLYNPRPRPEPPDRHCKDCKHWGGWAESYTAGKRVEQYALCRRDKQPLVKASPEKGCAFWASTHSWQPISGPRRPLRPQDDYIDPAG